MSVPLPGWTIQLGGRKRYYKIQYRKGSKPLASLARSVLLEHSVPNHCEVIELLTPSRKRGADFVRLEWREIALAPGAEWMTPRSWTIRG